MKNILLAISILFLLGCEKNSFENTCENIQNPILKKCEATPLEDIVRGVDLMEYYDERIDVDTLFDKYVESSYLPQAPIIDGVAEAPRVPLSMELDREVNCFHYDGEGERVNVEKFKCFVDLSQQ